MKKKKEWKNNELINDLSEDRNFGKKINNRKKKKKDRFENKRKKNKIATKWNNNVTKYFNSIIYAKQIGHEREERE